MIMSAAGAEDYARHSGEALSINRFRANFIISGCAAFDEDTWAEIWIGDVKLHNMKPCQRCSNTLVDPASGEKHAKFEPLRTLNKYTHSHTITISHHNPQPCSVAGTATCARITPGEASTGRCSDWTDRAGACRSAILSTSSGNPREVSGECSSTSIHNIDSR